MATKARADQSMQNVSIGPQLLLARSTNTPPPRLTTPNPPCLIPNSAATWKLVSPRDWAIAVRNTENPWSYRWEIP